MIDSNALKSIEDLHRLKTEGIITEEEFERSKERVLFGKPQVASAFGSTAPTTVERPVTDDHLSWATLALRRWSDFSGRSGRREYWMFQIIPFAVLLALFLAIGSSFDGYGDVRPLSLLTAGLLAMLLFPLAVPLLAAQVRRFHDQGKSGWFVLVNFVPYVGPLLVLIAMLVPGNAGDNVYGADPRQSSTF